VRRNHPEANAAEYINTISVWCKEVFDASGAMIYDLEVQTCIFSEDATSARRQDGGGGHGDHRPADHLAHHEMISHAVSVRGRPLIHERVARARASIKNRVRAWQLRAAAAPILKCANYYM
jgi:hypothetical protein